MALATQPASEPESGQPAKEDSPPPRLSPPWTVTKATLAGIGLAALVAVAWAWGHVGMSFTVLLDGLEDIRNLLGRMLPPRFEDTGDIVWLAVQTFFMAYIATGIATFLSTPLAFLAARNTSPHPLLRAAARAVISICRAVPDVVFAIIFVRAIGLGPLAGILALGLHSVGMVGKLYADAVEQIDETPRDAVLSAGASPRQALATAVVPQVLPGFVGTSLYRLDINVRMSVILGFVGAGGIGFELQKALGQLVYDRALGIVVVIVVMVVIIELISAGIRRSIIGEAALAPGAHGRGSRGSGLRRSRRSERTRAVRVDQVDRERPRAGGTERVEGSPPWTPPWTKPRVTNMAVLMSSVVLVVAAFQSVDLSPIQLVTNLPDIWETATRLFPPDFTTSRDALREGVVETVAIALVATFAGIILTLPFGFLSARNVAPNRTVYVLARGLVVVIRSVPELVLALIFVAAMGLGPVPGVFALAVGTVGFLAKLIADRIEEVEPAPREAVVATGASRGQETMTAVVPQAMPSLVGNALYMLDVNIRLSTIVGVVGAGGIGFMLDQSAQTLRFQTTGAIVVTVFVIVYGLELLGGWIRKKII